MTPNAISPRPLILAIDDTPSVLETLRFCLSTLRYDVVCAGDGRSGLQLAAQGGIALILLDVDMPGMNGITVCRTIRADAALAHVPVVIMTGRPGAEVRTQALEAGATIVIAKPFDLPLLERVLAETIKAGRELPSHERVGADALHLHHRPT